MFNVKVGCVFVPAMRRNWVRILATARSLGTGAGPICGWPLIVFFRAATSVIERL